MKSIHYEAEGDILSVTFADAYDHPQTGVELTDNIVLYYNPETEKPIKLMLISYQAMLRASAQSPILLDGLFLAPTKVRKTVLRLLQQAPLTALIELEEDRDRDVPASRLHEVFVPMTLHSVMAG
jgi:hypothetical protein